jgi:hypothetical protein
MNDEKKENNVETDLANAAKNEITKPLSFDLPESIEDFDLQDLRLSNIFICQDQSNKARDEGVQPGMLYDNLTLEGYESLNCIMFYSFTTRILYGANVGDSLVCYSQDGKVPSAPSPIHDNCVSCPENIKPADKIEKGKSRYGNCNRTFNFACILSGQEVGSEKDFPFLISMQRTNAPIAKNLINIVFRKRQELYDIERTITTKQTENDQGRFYTFQVTDLESISDEDKERCRYWLAFMKAMLKAQKLIIDYEGEEIERNVTPSSENNSNNETDIPF